MARQSFLHFYPERIMWIGFSLIISVFFLIVPLIVKIQSYHIPEIVLNTETIISKPVACEFTLGLKNLFPILPIPDFQKEMSFSLDPPRPTTQEEKSRFLVQLKKSSEYKRVELPCRIDLEYREGFFRFAKEKSVLSIELSECGDKIECTVNICINEEKPHKEQFFMPVQDCPIREASEFVEGSAFHFLAKARWLGKDLLSGSPHERFQIHSDLLQLEEDQWLVFKDGRWEKGSLQQERPIAHIESVTSKGLVFEGWGDEGYVRFCLKPSQEPSFKTKGEDLLNLVRIRSEKQVSCMLEKQCMILKLSDWVFKIDGKWKILRKKEDKEALLKGELLGELFILDQILQKQGQKMIQGRFFNKDRTQMIPVEIISHGNRKSKGPHKGKV